MRKHDKNKQSEHKSFKAFTKLKDRTKLFKNFTFLFK